MKKLLIMWFIPIVFISPNAHSLPPGQGDLVITEIMYNPSVVPDTTGEWFEIYNVSGVTLDLDGCVISDANIYATPFTIPAGHPIPPAGAVVVGANSDFNLNGGLNLDIQYEGIILNNNPGDTITLSYNGVTIDSVAYDGSQSPAGHSIELDPAYLDTTSNDDMANWAAAIFVFGSGDYGTPGVVEGSGGSYTITSSNGLHGAVYPSGIIEITIGENIVFSIVPDPWYEVSDILTNDISTGISGVTNFTWNNIQDRDSLFVAFGALYAINNTPQWWLAQYGWSNDFDTAALSDIDADTLATWEEYLAGTNPTNSNTDGDQFNDGVEVSSGADALRDDSQTYSAILNNQSAFDLYTPEQLGALALGDLMIQSSNSDVYIDLQLLKSNDLIAWTNAGGAVEWSMPAGDKEFYKVRAEP